MKKTIVVLLALVLISACKKKEDSKTPDSPVTPVPNIISVKIDGTLKQCSSCYSGYKSGGLSGSYFYLNGSNESIYFSCSKWPSLGTHSLVKYGNPYLMYSKNNTYYRATNGSITITAIDTSAKGVVNKLMATFNFQTDTSSGVFFNLTEGLINLELK